VQDPDQLAAKAADAVAQRDAVQANLLELEGSFGKRLLAGASLTGRTGPRWDVAATTLADLWQTFTAYSAVVDRIAELAHGGRRMSQKDLPELTELLTGRSVPLTRAPAPLARRDLADTGRQDLTVAGAVAAMRRAFSEVAEVTAAAEGAWTDVAGRLAAAGAQLAAARDMVAGLGGAGLGDDGLAARLAAAGAELESQRTVVNSDPLALWHDGRADTSAADRLAGEASALTAEIAGLDRLRREARDRIEQLRVAADAARAARKDITAMWQRAATRITGVPPLPSEPAEPPLARLTALAAAGRWAQLRAELDRCGSELAAARTQTSDTERSLASLLGQRDELRGLLDAYKAKAARLGSAEDTDLAARYDHARDLLWTAPCDLAAAADAVTGYQRAIRAMEGQRR
jgi:hypothetical protein